MVIYVGDLKLAGPKANIEVGLNLGCLLSKGYQKLHDGTTVSTMTYNMEGLSTLSVEKYQELGGKDMVLKKVSTPSLPAETKKHKSRAQCEGNLKNKVTCTWCAHQFDPAIPLALSRETIDFHVASGESNRGALAPLWSCCTLPGAPALIYLGQSVLWPGM